ncbi:MAG TPA: hypothetical protein VN520_04830 [Streptomyces sp.]|uniref:hypothetical protein n=1 Tax=Streptomyces sp. TaxID=1931 RepID=UPI002C25AD7F|nr:hypothetical protein [Streptomyces sp.]HWU05713.1 hypothetical protein [Streptomyces sp.]
MSEETGGAPFRVPAEFVRYAVALEPAEVACGYVSGWVSAKDAVRLAFLRRCDLRELAGEFDGIAALDPSAPELGVLCRRLADGCADAGRVWAHLAVSWACSRPDGQRDRLLGRLGAGVVRPVLDFDGGVPRPSAAGRAEFLVGRAASGRGMNWRSGSALLGTDRPEEVDAAFDRGEDLVGVAVIGLALQHPDAEAVLPRVARALGSADEGLRHQARVALAHVARLHGTVDRRCLELLRSHPRGNEADDDLWAYVPHRLLPWWLWRHHLRERLAWHLRERWRG